MARFTHQREAEIIQAYEDWDLEQGTIDQLVDGLNISKQSLYSILRRNDVKLKSSEGRFDGGFERRPIEMGDEIWAGGPDGKTWEQILPDSILQTMAKTALRTLLEEVVQLKNENAELKARLDREPT